MPADYGERLVQDYIAPAMQGFQASARQLQASLQAWCALPAQQDAPGAAAAMAAPGQAGDGRAPSGSISAGQLDEAFAQTVEAWSGIEFLRFGPLVAANRYERIYFWPDPRGVTLRQVQGLLAKPDSVPDAKALATHSVALQGLPALEYVLYKENGVLSFGGAAAPAGASGSPGAASRSNAAACDYAAAVAGNLAAVGAELVQAWMPGGEYARQFSRPLPDSTLYRSQQEVAGEAIKALSTGLQFARDVKLLPVLGDSPEAAQYKRAPFWRSGLSARAMGAAVQGMIKFYQAGAYQYGHDEAWVDRNVQEELQRARDDFSAMRGDAQQLVHSAEGYRQLTLASLLLKNAKVMVDEHMAPAFGVRIGFNALDGD
ncbi:imelysin family protein [Pusillimonas sp. SM2304]|uniref:imelysin family protein n=1 Tax=Pusillimonas sp. SM2304 TaxID=3073241 RepID=UPI0038F5EAC9